MTPTISDSERHALAEIAEAGITNPSIALLRARIMLDHAKNARDIAHGWPSLFSIDADGRASLDHTEAVAFDAYVHLLNEARGEPSTINVSITRGGVTTNLSTCRLDSPEELERLGLLAPWIEPDPIGFGTLTPFEREQTARLAEVTIAYCADDVGHFASSAD